MRKKTYSFDNCRAFTTRSKDGRESGFDGWLRIIAKGRRDFLPAIDPERSALLIVDLQKGCVQGWPQAGHHDVQVQFHEQRSEYMDSVVMPNVVRLLELFRKNDMLVVYTTLGPDDVVPAIAPDYDRNEIVVTKYSSGAFATSPLDNVLREHGIATLFFVGTATDGCVDATMSVAYDLGYQTILVDDACCGHSPELHEAAVKIWTMKGFVRNTAQVVDDYPWQAWVEPDVSDEYELTRIGPNYW